MDLLGYRYSLFWTSQLQADTEQQPKRPKRKQKLFAYQDSTDLDIRSPKRPIPDQRRHFLNLPQELRDHILSFVINPSRNGISLQSHFLPSSKACKDTKSYLALVSTCKAIRKDVLRIVWSRRSTIDIWPAESMPQLAPDTLASLRNMRIISSPQYVQPYRNSHVRYDIAVLLKAIGGNWILQLQILHGSTSNITVGTDHGRMKHIDQRPNDGTHQGEVEMRLRQQVLDYAQPIAEHVRGYLEANDVITYELLEKVVQGFRMAQGRRLHRFTTKQP